MARGRNRNVMSYRHCSSGDFLYTRVHVEPKVKPENPIAFEKHRRLSIRAAMELCYPDSVVKAVRNARTSAEITRILERARKAM